MNFITRLTCIPLLLVGTFSASNVIACTFDAWNGGVSGSPVAGSPTAVSRVFGECAMKLSAPGSVKDTSPANESAAIIRFYVYSQLSAGSPVIFEAFSDDNATASLLTISFDGSNFVFDAGNEASANVPGETGWNLVEISWTSGGSMDYWVNADSVSEPTPTGSVTAAAGTMESVILGTSDSYTGSLTFDDYVSHRSTPVGGLLLGDTNNDGTVNVFDISATLLEIDFFNPVLQQGTPDCNMDGQVNVFDISALLLAIDFFNPVPCNSN